MSPKTRDESICYRFTTSSKCVLTELDSTRGHSPEPFTAVEHTFYWIKNKEKKKSSDDCVDGVAFVTCVRAGRRSLLVVHSVRVVVVRVVSRVRKGLT